MNESLVEDHVPTFVEPMKVVDGEGPPSSHVLFSHKPQVNADMLSAAVFCLRFHTTFPFGIRERLFHVLAEDYSLTKEQSRTLTTALSQETEGKCLGTSDLLQIGRSEKRRLLYYSIMTGKNTSHLLVPPLVPTPTEQGKPPKYTNWEESQNAMTRSMPSLRAAGDMVTELKPAWKTWKGPPLSYNPVTRKMNCTGYFMKMPALGV